MDTESLKGGLEERVSYTHQKKKKWRKNFDVTHLREDVIPLSNTIFNYLTEHNNELGRAGNVEMTETP